MPQNGTIYNDVDGNLYAWLRIVNGISEGSKEIIHNSSIPLEANMEIFNGIDFEKGCYLGQELVSRTFHTGMVRKRHYPFITLGKYSEFNEMNKDSLKKVVSATQENVIPTGLVDENGDVDVNLIKFRDNIPPVSGTPLAPLVPDETTGEFTFDENLKRTSEVVHSVYNASIVMTRVDQVEDFESGALFVTKVAGEKQVLKAIKPIWYPDTAVVNDSLGVDSSSISIDEITNMDEILFEDPGDILKEYEDEALYQGEVDMEKSIANERFVFEGENIEVEEEEEKKEEDEDF